MTRIDLSYAQVKELFDYNPETGLLRWRKGQHGRRKNGVVGTVNSNGYVQVKVDYVCYLAHRIIWTWMTGGHPPEMVEHRDLVGVNNVWSNLRAATNSSNQMNIRKHRDNTSGYKGVLYEPKCTRRPWRARITVRGEIIELGRGVTREEAITLRRAGTRKYHGEFGRE